MNINPFKKKEASFAKASATMIGIEKLVKADVIKFNPNTYEAWINTDLHWNGKDQAWRENFITNLKTFIDFRRILKKGEITSDTIKVYDIESKELLITQKVD